MAGGRPAQTIWPALFAPHAAGAARLAPRALDHARPRLRRRRLAGQRGPGRRAADGDVPRPEGSSASHYVQAMADTPAAGGLAHGAAPFAAARASWNPAPRATSLGAITPRSAGCWLRPAPATPVPHGGLWASLLGGNALMRWGQEAGGQAGELARAGFGVLAAGLALPAAKPSPRVSTSTSTRACSCAP